MPENKDLKEIYDKVYSKGEDRHYTRLLFSNGKLTNDKRAILKAVAWKGKKVLDVGCGTGEVAYRIAQKGASHVLGIDYSKSAITTARSKYQHARLSFLQKDLKKVNGIYDVVISMGTLEHTDSPFAVLKNLTRHVRKGGSLLLTCPNWVNPRGYMLQTLRLLFHARITLADLHYLTPVEFEAWAKKLSMKLHWRTVDHDWGHGKRLVEDFKNRIPNVLRDSKLPYEQKRVDAFIDWIDTHVALLETNKKFGGVTGVYHFKK